MKQISCPNCGHVISVAAESRSRKTSYYLCQKCGGKVAYKKLGFFRRLFSIKQKRGYSLKQRNKANMVVAVDQNGYLAETIAIETAGKTASPIFSSGIPLPASVSQIFSTAEDNQTAISINILVGNSKSASECKSLGIFNHGGLLEAPKSVPQIEITFHIDHEGVLSVMSHDLATHKETRIGPYFLTISQDQKEIHGLDGKVRSIKSAIGSSRQELGESLCNAAESGDVGAVRILLSQGADPRYKTGPKCASPILIAAHKGHARVVHVLIEAGVDVNEANTDGLTPLIAASMNDHIKSVRLLCENNADPNSQTINDKYTALMYAKSKEVFKILLDRGADTSLRNKWGDTVLELAQAHKYNEFIRLIKSSKKVDIDRPTEQKIRHIKEIQTDLFGHGDRFDTTFEILFSYLKDKDPEIKSLAATYLAFSPEAVERLISIYRASIIADPSRAVQAGRVLGRKLSRGESIMVSEKNTAFIYGINLAFTYYSCSFCGKFNLGIPVPTRYLSFYGQKESKGANNSLPVLCDFCNKEFFLCWD